MTSARTMSRGSRARRALALALALGLPAAALAFGCTPQLREPTSIATPYTEGRLWAVAPFHNESGTSVVDTARAADAFVAEAQDVDGISVLPVNRVIYAMRRLGLNGVDTHGDAMKLMNALDLDGLVVGTITAYDPYRPQQLGMAVQLYVRDDRRARVGVDPRQLARMTHGDAAPGAAGPPHPVAQAAGQFDASNHRVLGWLRQYADGRNEPDSAYGPDIYLVDMDLYTRFVCHRLLCDLLDDERVRLTPVASVEP